MRTGSLLFTTVLILMLSIEAKAADIITASTTIASDGQIVVPISCTTKYLSLDKVAVFSTAGTTIGRDDTFVVRVNNDCHSSENSQILSSNGSVKEFIWWRGPLGLTTDRTQICITVQCTNWFLSCNIKYDVIVNCHDAM